MWAAYCSNGIRRASSPGSFPIRRPRPSIRQQMFEHADWHEFDRGTLSEAAAIEHFAQAAGLTTDETRKLIHATRESLTPIAGTIELVEELVDGRRAPLPAVQHAGEHVRLPHPAAQVLRPLQAPGDLRRHPAREARARDLQTPGRTDRHRARRERVHRRPAEEHHRGARMRLPCHPVHAIPRAAASSFAPIYPASTLDTEDSAHAIHPKIVPGTSGRRRAGRATPAPRSRPAKANDTRRRRSAEPHELAQSARHRALQRRRAHGAFEGQDRFLAQDVLRLRHRQRALHARADARRVHVAGARRTATTPRSTTRPASWSGSTRNTG